MDEQAETLSAELQAAVVRALRREWETINANYFRFALRMPLFILGDADGRLGCWDAQTRTIEISRRLMLAHPWGVVVEVLKHEIAHQYAHELRDARDEKAHGEAFRAGCARLGIDPAASGLPAPSSLGEDESRLPRRIAKLLALAESPNRHEAESAMREAQRLMLKYNLEAPGVAADRRYAFRHLGEPTGRLQPHQRHLGAIVGRFFFVEAIWVTVHRPLVGQSGTVLEVCGTEPNLEMASYVHEFLLRTSERLWRDHKRAQRIESDRDRRSFLTGVMRGFYEKLEEQERRSRGEGLVWIRDRGLSDYYRARHPHCRTVHSTARAAPAAFHHGKEAGRGIVLHKPVKGEAGGGVRAMLPPRRG